MSSGNKQVLPGRSKAQAEVRDLRGGFEPFELAAAASEVGLDGAALEARLGPWMAALVEHGHLPCAATLVARRGKVAYCKGTGQQTASRPLADDTIYRIYSMSKPITSAALMMLHEEGRFLLSHPAHLYLGPRWRKKAMVLVGSRDPRKSST